MVGQPRRPDIRGRVTLNKIVPLPVTVGGPHIGELPTHRRDRLPLQQLVEVLLAAEKRQLAGDGDRRNSPVSIIGIPQLVSVGPAT